MSAVAALVEDLGRGLCPDSDKFLGPDKGTQVRVWFHRICSLKGFLAPAAGPGESANSGKFSFVLPTRENCRPLMGGRASLLSLPES